MDLRKRLVLLVLIALLVAVAGTAGITTFVLQQQSAQQAQLQEPRRLVGTSNIAYNAIVDELSRLQVAARYLALNQDVITTLLYQSPGTVQNNLLEPYRVAEGLSFISLVTSLPRVQIAQAKALSPSQVPSISIVVDALKLQQDRSGIWDGPARPADAPVPQVPYAVAASPVLASGNRLLGVVVVGRTLDSGYMSRISANLGDFQAAIVKEDLMLAMPPDLEQSFRDAHAARPYRALVQPARETIALPGAFWQLAIWRAGAARYVVVTRPLNSGSKDELAVAVPAPRPWGATQLFLGPAAWLSQKTGSSVDTTFGIITEIGWWSLLLLLLLAIGALAGTGVHLALRPVRRLTERVEAFRQGQAWPTEPAGAGEFGRLRGEVAALAGEASSWLRELSAYRDRLQFVLDSMGTGVVVSNGEGRVELINPAARELLGIGAGTAHLPAAVSRPSADPHAFRASNGRVINAVSTPIRRGDGGTMGLVTVLEDMTREHELERVRSDFLTVVSHELRTPLTAVKGSLELLLDGEAGALEPLQQRFLQTARRNTERLIALVNDLLDLSRLEAGQVRLSIQPADVRRIVDDVVINLGTIFEHKRQEVHLDLPPQPLLIMADRRRFEQVVTNLLGNAATYTPDAGQICVQAQADPEAGQAVLTVRNSGPGIAPEDREHLFEKFYRGGNALTRQDGGSGLGLAIVKSLVDLHHGTIAVESEPGEGAAFIVRLPLAGDGRENSIGG